MTAPTWADTPEGIVCAAIHARMQDDFPSLIFGFGPDGESLNRAPSSIVFTFADDQIAPGFKVGTPWRREIPLTVELWMADPVEAIDAWSSFLLALNEKAHGRAGTPHRAKKSGGEIGAAGAKVVGSFILRLAVLSRARRQATATAQPISTTITGADGSNPETVDVAP